MYYSRLYPGSSSTVGTRSARHASVGGNIDSLSINSRLYAAARLSARDNLGVSVSILYAMLGRRFSSARSGLHTT